MDIQHLWYIQVDSLAVDRWNRANMSMQLVIQLLYIVNLLRMVKEHKDFQVFEELIKL